MDLERSNKQKCREDTINRLPNEMLCEILSRLPTKDAVQTTVLSSKWKNLWTSVHNLHFDDAQFIGDNRNVLFRNFVKRVLTLCKSKDIQCFRLKSNSLESSYEVSCLRAWLCFAAEHNVCHLDLDVCLTWVTRVRFVRLPQSILTCKTLTELTMHKDFAITIPDSMVCFPSLKILRLWVLYPKRDLMQKLFCNCPVLEDLSIKGDLQLVVPGLTFKIVVPTLLRLSIRLSTSPSKRGYMSDHKFLIDACNLEYLYIKDDSLGLFVLNEAPFLKKGYVDIGHCLIQVVISKEEAYRAIELLKGTNHAKCLSLSFSMMAAISYAYNGDFPSFPNLTHLALKIDPQFRWKMLPHLLNSSPNLEVLILKKVYPHCTNCENEKYYVRDRRRFDPGYVDWVEPENVPYCLLFNVKKIKMKNMTGEDNELDVVSYLLKNSQVLEKFSIGISLFQENLQKRILMFPMGSKTCKIEFL